MGGASGIPPGGTINRGMSSGIPVGKDEFCDVLAAKVMTDGTVKATELEKTASLTSVSGRLTCKCIRTLR